MKLYIIKFAASPSAGRLEHVLDRAVSSLDIPVVTEYITSTEQFSDLADKGKLQSSRLIFAVETDISGINPEACKLLRYLRLKSIYPAAPCGDLPDTENLILSGAAGGIIVDGQCDLFTKDLGRRLAFTANLAGCNFPGKPLSEATSDLRNFRVLAGIWQTDCYEAYVRSCTLLLQKVLNFRLPVQDHPSILAVHASNRRTSNSLALWEMTSAHLAGKADIEVISIRNGQLWDCRGCKYEECLHFGEKGDCFYGGVMVEKVYPAIVRSDVLVLICPNYNDSVSANMMAFINRLTAVFRARDFSRKRVYAVIVSGYSGGDIVAQQIIGAINMNKNLILPGNFALMTTANDPGEALELPGIKAQTAAFARRILVDGAG
ncbi:MAG: flavodoxin family protein [Anaerovoracaceae bacterium]